MLSSASSGCDSHSRIAASPYQSSKHELVRHQPRLITPSRSAQYTAKTKGCQGVLNPYATVDMVCTVPACRRCIPCCLTKGESAVKCPLCLGPVAHEARCLQALGSLSMGQQGHRDSCAPALSTAAAHLQPPEARGHERGHWQISCSSPVSCQLACAAAFNLLHSIEP